MKINGIDLVFDFYDSDQKEKREIYLEELRKINVLSGTPVPEGMSGVDWECENVKTFFDRVFGEGVGDMVCGTGHNHLACLEAFDSLITEVNDQHRRYRKVRQKFEKQGKKKK